MGFRTKHPRLLEEQYRNTDELIRLTSEERSLALRLEAVRERRRDLRARNEEICYEMRPVSQSSVTFADFRNRLRLEPQHQSATAA